MRESKRESKRERERREREPKRAQQRCTAAGILSDATECCDSLVSRGPVDLRAEPTQSV